MDREPKGMSEEEFENFVAVAIEQALLFPECGETPDDNYEIRTFHDAGV